MVQQNLQPSVIPCSAVLAMVERSNRLNIPLQVRLYNGRKLDDLGFRYGRLMRVLVWVLEDTLSILQRYEAFSRDINLDQKTSHTV